jgi:hypothetical protein
MTDLEIGLWSMIAGCAVAVAFIVHVAMRPE